MKSWAERVATWSAMAAAMAAIAGLGGCGGGGGGTTVASNADGIGAVEQPTPGTPTAPPTPGPAPAPAPAPSPVQPPAPPVPAAPAALTCDDSLKTHFAPDGLTQVLMVKPFSKGAPLVLAGAPAANTPIAENDLCMVKLNVGPGNPGPADAPSTSAGIGIEVWLPAHANWNGRIHVKGGSGWAGGAHASLTALGNTDGVAGTPAATAGIEGAVSASTDAGHAVQNGSFAMNPDGTINTVLWKDYADRAVHEMAVKTKALARAYYGKDARYTYFNGFSTGGREGLKEAQAHPEDFDGILAGAPAINRTRFVTGQLYPQIVTQRDLAGVALTQGQRSLVSNAAISACDVVGGQHLGYLPDPAQCRYDPTTDAAVLCAVNGGSNTGADCVTPLQARAFNKFWYGQTADGSVPSPAVDNGFGSAPGSSRKWYGYARGTDLSLVAGPSPFPIATEMVALELENPSYAAPGFANATGNGANRWTSLTYAELANASDRGVALQDKFGGINTDSADLTAFRGRGGKLIMYHGLADPLIPHQGSIHYYESVAAQMGGMSAAQAFSRLYLVAGMSHGLWSGSANAAANPPVPNIAQLYSMLTDWVEKGIAPGRVDLTAYPSLHSRPMCVYPQKPTYVSGDPLKAGSYACE